MERVFDEPYRGGNSWVKGGVVEEMLLPTRFMFLPCEADGPKPLSIFKGGRLHREAFLSRHG